MARMNGLFGTERHTDVFVAAEYLDSAPVDALARVLSIPPKAMRTIVFELRDAGVVFTPTVEGDLHVAFNSHHIAAGELRALARKLRAALPRYERQSAQLDARFPRALPTAPPGLVASTPRPPATRNKKSVPATGSRKRSTAKKTARKRKRR